METEFVERVLRDLPGVLDCSVHDEGIAVVVHPEMDPRVLELRAQVALAEIGERRPLLVVGGMSSGIAEPPPSRPRRGRILATRSPLSVVGFTVLGVALITVVPIAGRDAKPPVGLPSVAAPRFVPPALGGAVPIVDEPVAAVATAVFGPVAGATRAAVRAVRAALPSSRQAGVAAAAPAAAPAPAGHVRVKAAPPHQREVAGAAKHEAKGKAKAVKASKAKGKVKAAGARARPGPRRR